MGMLFASGLCHAQERSSKEADKLLDRVDA